MIISIGGHVGSLVITTDSLASIRNHIQSHYVPMCITQMNHN